MNSQEYLFICKLAKRFGLNPPDVTEVKGRSGSTGKVELDFGEETITIERTFLELDKDIEVVCKKFLESLVLVPDKLDKEKEGMKSNISYLQILNEQRQKNKDLSKLEIVYTCTGPDNARLYVCEIKYNKTVIQSDEHTKKQLASNEACYRFLLRNHLL